jgi:uncharacterized Tic20 family protein
MTQQQLPGAVAPAPRGDERVLAILAHLSPILASVLTAGWLSLIGPFLVWLIWRKSSPLVRTASATSFNFTITIWVAQVVGWIMIISIILLPIGLVFLFVPTVLQWVFSIIGAVKAAGGIAYKYPLQVPLLS